MYTSYVIKDNQLLKTDTHTPADVTIYKAYSKHEVDVFAEKYQLPKSVFYLNNNEPIAPRYEKLSNTLLGETMIIILSNIQSNHLLSTVEERLEHHIFILGESQLFWFMANPQSTIKENLFEEYSALISSQYSVILYYALLSYKNFNEELAKQKKQIQYLNKQADRASDVQLISQVTTTEQDLIILEHTIDSQELAINGLVNNKKTLSNVKNTELVYEIKQYRRIVKETIHMYRDLFDAVSNLYSDIINNNLNQIMRYLSSISIIIATSALIASLWGMNTGGLPFKDQNFGTLIMLLIAIAAGVLMYLFLKKKDFFDE